jgi:hypothetical protein
VVIRCLNVVAMLVPGAGALVDERGMLNAA